MLHNKIITEALLFRHTVFQSYLKLKLLGTDCRNIPLRPFQQILPTGQTLSYLDMVVAAPLAGNKLWALKRLHVCPSSHFAFAAYWATEQGTESGMVSR